MNDIKLSLIEAASFSPSSLEPPNAWVGHLPFAAWVIRRLRPEVFVELGTHSGNSYFAFCQAVHNASLQTKCYSVDTWKGEEHAGYYDEEVFHKVNDHNHKNYERFSRLLRMTFDEAAGYFSEGSIDLLHIDGCHSYEAVSHDFEKWLPKLAGGAVVLFHDINVRERGFGVWKLWEELKERYPKHLEFFHSHGLGVLQIDDADQGGDEWLQPQSPLQQILKDYFAALGARQSERLELENLKTSLHELNTALSTKDGQIAELNQAVAGRDGQIAELNQAIAEHDGQIASLNQAVSEREGQVTCLKQAVAERDGQIEKLQQATGECDGHVAWLRQEMDDLLGSNSWRMTRPLRFLRRNLLENCFDWGQRSFSVVSMVIWKCLPFSNQRKQKIKDILFFKFPFFFRSTQAYRRWTDHKEIIKIQDHPPNSEEKLQSWASYVPLLKAAPAFESPAKLICFYLPQYHPIAENDEWWGEGFTEWTNVKPAKPQFKGHYQPHVPGDLGYYSLLDPEVQHRQVKLARLYGIGGFCFYFYWFGGVRLLETPIENYLKDSSLDMPFCLCWANENWSRRWDGLDSEILIAQKHSAEDDIEFISYVARYMRDSRYIRIDGKPLLLVYRPSLLPSARDTVKRWREWCQENDIGEIYLAYTQSFETVDPVTYGFDAAIEFPPNNSAPPKITDSILVKENSDFAGSIYDWRVFVARSRNYNNPDYKLFRCVNPGWDNTARKKTNGNIFLNNTPQGYQEWLYNAIIDTRSRFVNHDEQLVFVNAWNEWAEGAHLEPDQRNGYAYLEATRMAQARISRTIWPKSKIIAIVIHAFYGDIFNEILKRVENISIPFKLFVTTSHELYNNIDCSLSNSGFPYELTPVDNRGRDVLPFLKALEGIVSEGYAYILKIHTKKSLHREDGDFWRNDLYSKLLDNEVVQRSVYTFDTNDRVGLIGPAGHIVPMKYYFGSNAETIMQLAHRLGQSAETVMSLNFIAGTMFFARTDALLPILNLGLSDSDFEPEAGQIDGTLAHALERLFSISSFSKAYILIDSEQNEESGMVKYEFARRSA